MCYNLIGDSMELNKLNTFRGFTGTNKWLAKKPVLIVLFILGFFVPIPWVGPMMAHGALLTLSKVDIASETKLGKLIDEWAEWIMFSQMVIPVLVLVILIINYEQGV